VRVDSRDVPLAVAPDSLALGDIDHDGRLDACGRDAAGLLCATAASGYVARRFSPALAAVDPTSAASIATDRSLAIAPDGRLCALAADGVVCVAAGAGAALDVRSAWPDRRAALWVADLDGDRQVDWCVATASGPACGLAGDAAITRDGGAWGYALAGAVEASAGDGPPDPATAVFTDIDGDGRDDLCAVRGATIACARSLGHGLSPRSPVARLPAGLTPTSLWAEPARPGQPPRLCAADAATSACTD
jgi:hypothetical protein